MFSSKTYFIHRIINFCKHILIIVSEHIQNVAYNMKKGWNVHTIAFTIHVAIIVIVTLSEAYTTSHSAKVVAAMPIAGPLTTAISSLG